MQLYLLTFGTVCATISTLMAVGFFIWLGARMDHHEKNYEHLFAQRPLNWSVQTYTKRVKLLEKKMYASWSLWVAAGLTTVLIGIYTIQLWIELKPFIS